MYLIILAISRQLLSESKITSNKGIDYLKRLSKVNTWYWILTETTKNQYNAYFKAAEWISEAQLFGFWFGFGFRTYLKQIGSF